MLAVAALVVVVVPQAEAVAANLSAGYHNKLASLDYPFLTSF